MSPSPTLSVFQDLKLRAPASRLPALRQALIRHIAAPWSHAETNERNLADQAGNSDVIVFERSEDPDVAAASLVLWSRTDGYEVTNIVPIKKRELGHRGYNAVLQDFINRVATPAAVDEDVTIQTTAAEQPLENWLPGDAAQALRRFSGAANKSTGSSHPLDRTRWFNFLIEAHKATQTLDAEQLARWLIEVESWSEDKAHDLAAEYEFGLHLLDEYDRTRV